MANTNLKIVGRALVVTTDISVEDITLIGKFYMHRDAEGNDIFGVIYNPRLPMAYVSASGIEFTDANDEDKLQLTFMLCGDTKEDRIKEVKERFLDIISELNVCTTLIKEAATAKRAQIADTFETMEVLD